MMLSEEKYTELVNWVQENADTCTKLMSLAIESEDPNGVQFYRTGGAVYRQVLDKLSELQGPK